MVMSLANAKAPLSKERRLFCLVPRRGLEPPRPKGTGPQPAAYANSATGARYDPYYSAFGFLVNLTHLAYNTFND